MNQDHKRFNIPIECDGQRFNIKVDMDGDMFTAYGSEFENLQSSSCGFGFTIEQAVESYLEQYGEEKKFYMWNPADPENHLIEVNLPQNDNL